MTGTVIGSRLALVVLWTASAGACTGTLGNMDDHDSDEEQEFGDDGEGPSSMQDDDEVSSAGGAGAPSKPKLAVGEDAVDALPSGQGGAAGETASPDAGAVVATPPAPPEGLVPMFVAAGNGGRTVTSCDDGKTWIANHQYENRDEDHSPYTHKGFAYGKGWFVSLMGWGAKSSLKISADGVNWKRVEPFTNTLGTIAFDGENFVVFGQSDSSYATDPSAVWTRGGATRHSTHLRGGGGGAAANGRGAVAGGGDRATPVMSWDGGKTWATATGCPGMQFSNLGQEGNATFGAGALLLVSDDGKTCRITDGGRKREAGQLGGAVVGKASWLGDRFMVVSDTRAYFSADGTTWETKQFAPVGTKLRMVAKAPSGTYVAISASNNVFYRSSDAITWTRVVGPTGPRIIDLQFGYGKPSALCPRG